jgi:PAS domain S-box-containing protein
VAKILVVDDNPTNRSFLVTLLGYGGHTVLEASDGAEALVLVSAERPDLVIADILMPTMDGYELVRRLRSTPEISGTPVIFCTAHFRERDARDLARECGVSLVLTKPCEPEVVIRAVDDCLSEKPAAAAPKVDQSFDREHLRLLTDKLSEQTSELTAANLRLQALLDISLPLASEDDPARLLDRFCTAARDLITARYSFVGIPSPDRNSLVHFFGAGIGQDLREIGFPPSHSIFAAVMESRRPMRLRNPRGEPRALQFPEALRNFESLLVAPIVSPKEAYGWVCLFHRLGAVDFSDEDERLAGILAALVGRIYENGRIHASERLHAAALKREIGERRRAQEESARLADIVQSSDDAIIGMTLNGTISNWNRGAERIFGYAAQEIQGTPLRDLFASDRAEEIREKLEVLQRGRGVDRYETAGIKRGGGAMELAVTMSPITKPDGTLSGASAIVRDITAQKRLQQQLFIGQKMEAMGRLSAGVAHDFNNLLTVIEGYSEVLLSRRKEKDPEYPDIIEIKKAAERAAALTRQLLAFSRRQIVQPRVLDLRAVVMDMGRMLRRVIGPDIELITALDPSLGSTKADLGQLEQVIMNLAVNSRDAMPSGGKLVIEASNVDLHERLELRNTVVPPGAWVLLAFTDTGVGMNAETQDRIFEPFFTTKQPGQGTGLGLSTVYGIVEQNGGVIAVESEPGHGTAIRIFLRRVDEAAPVEAAEPASATRRGSETVLVVDDEDAVRKLICGILKHEGYRTLQAKNGGEGLQVCEQYPEKINLMISDVMMPGMTGVALASRVSSIRPDMKVLLMSGYTEQAVMEHADVRPDVPLLEKPFVPRVLTRKVRELLDTEQSQGYYKSGA